MRLSLRAKLFLTLLFACAVSVLAVQGSMYWSFRHGLREMLEQRLQVRMETLGARLLAQYRADGGWSRLAQDRRLWLTLVDARGPRPFGDRPPPARPDDGPRGGRPWSEEGRAANHDQRPRNSPQTGPPTGPATGPRPGHAFAKGPQRALLSRRLVLLNTEGQPVVGVSTEADRSMLERSKRALRLPLELDGTRVGELILLPGPPIQEAAEQRFRQRQTAALPIIALVTLSLSALLAWWLSRRLARPVLRFRATTRQLASGDFGARAPVAGGDELAGLGRDLNTLAATLEQNEQARRRWVADISHELRTPVGLLRAELEAMQDGVRPLDTTAVAALHGDTLRLSRLIDDLYQLALSDLGALSYRKTEADLGELLEEAITGFRAQFATAGLDLHFDNRLRAPAVIQADPQRLAQLFANLLRNSVQYTDRGGALLVRLTRISPADARDESTEFSRVASAEDSLAIDFQDTAPGVPEAERTRLFERLYRVEPSRSRAAGGAGLGLAIAKNIVEAHQGRIEARAAPQGGLWIRILLPRAP